MASYSLFDVGACNCVTCVSCSPCTGANCIPGTNLTLTWAYSGSGTGTQALIYNGLSGGSARWVSAYFAVGGHWFVFTWGCFSGSLTAQMQESNTNGGIIITTCGPPLAALGSITCSPVNFGYKASSGGCPAFDIHNFTSLVVTL
jgi:hypothetical protein